MARTGARRAAEAEPDGGQAQREAARLRYELSRLQDRRAVRAALAVGELRRGGAGAAFAALRGAAPRLDVPGPAVVPLRPPYPHLRTTVIGTGHLVTSTCVHEHATPETVATLLRRDRPDLLLIDDPSGWTQAELDAAAEAARREGTSIVTVGSDAAAALPDAHLRVALEQPVSGAVDLGPRVDVRCVSPAGLDSTVPAHRSDAAATLDLAAARRQPVVVVPDVATVGAQRCLELLAAGAVVVTVGPTAQELAVAASPRARFAAALRDGLDAETADLVLGEAGTLEERAERLLADDELRHRVSVRLRRRVHAAASTRAALIAVVRQLGRDGPPPARISVLLATLRPDRVRAVCAAMAAQRYPDVELLLLPHGDVPVADDLPGVTRVERVPAERPLGAVLDVGLDLATGAYIAKVDDDDRYGPDHLGDLVLALQHSGADAAGRRVHGVFHEDASLTVRPPAGGEERFEDHLPGPTLLVDGAAMRQVRWRHVPRAVDTELIRALHLAGGSVYTSHRYGFVRVRHGDGHTFGDSGHWTGEVTPGFAADLLEA